jgi:hypothetical protein
VLAVWLVAEAFLALRKARREPAERVDVDAPTR